MRIFDCEHTAPKAHRGGTHRTRPPRETLAAFSPLMPRLGITRLANVTGLDRIGVPVWVSVRPNARSLSVSQGKGLDHDSAKASALMESIEVWHAENVVLPVKHASVRELRGSAAILDVATQQGRRPSLSDEEIIGWVEGYDLIGRQRRWVPLDAVELEPDRSGPRAFSSDSNGLASGNHLLEAVVHGLCEVIERDAVTLWFLAEDVNTKVVQVDPSSVRDPGCTRLLEDLRRAGLVVGAFDATSDLGVPTYACIVADRPGTLHAMGHFWGFGCHLDPAVALCRAMTEAVQCRLTEISGARDDIDDQAYAKGRDDDELRGIAEMVEGEPAPLDFGARPSIATDSFEGDVETLLAALERAGLGSAAVVDHTRPDIGVPVVHVFVPRLEGYFTPDYVPGPRARELLGA